jgi:hypothetical protein
MQEVEGDCRLGIHRWSDAPDRPEQTTNIIALPCILPVLSAICSRLLSVSVTAVILVYQYLLMAIACDDKRRVADVDSDSVPSKTQWLGPYRRTRSPPLKRVITYDCDVKTVQIRKMMSFES